MALGYLRSPDVSKLMIKDMEKAQSIDFTSPSKDKPLERFRRPLAHQLLIGSQDSTNYESSNQNRKNLTERKDKYAIQ